MKRNLLFLFIIINLCFSGNAQKKDIKQTILEEANKMGKFFIAKDYASFARYSHPTMIEMMGGQEKAIEYIKTNFEQLEKEGVVFQRITFGEPSKILTVKGKEREELQCTMPQMIEMKIPGGIFTANATLICVSWDKGANWFFVDTSGNDLTSMRKLIPALSEELVIPENQEPSFIEDEPVKP